MSSRDIQPDKSLNGSATGHTISKIVQSKTNAAVLAYAETPTGPGDDCPGGSLTDYTWWTGLSVGFIIRVSVSASAAGPWRRCVFSATIEDQGFSRTSDSSAEVRGPWASLFGAS